MSALRLGVNIDHVATIRNARGGDHPDPVRAANIAAAAGADGITVHLREDRRHITDADLARLADAVTLPINLEMAATDEMLAIALRARPNAACIVPERRQERTTEGGLDVVGGDNHLLPMITKLREGNMRVSLFIEPSLAQIEASVRVGATIVELHTGKYSHLIGAARETELNRLREAAKAAHFLGLEVHAGHGLTFENVGAIAAIPEVMELNIGHFLIGEAVFVGLEASIRAMRAAIDAGRAGIEAGPRG
jgi:pyridoxine 5-phosphate synthase